MLQRKHSKLCLRRISSRNTLISEDRHSRICMRGRAQKFRDRLRATFSVLRKPPERQDYFTGRLPPEIRLLIYRHALHFDTPITLNRNPKRGLKSKKAGILAVNRLTYTEALPILHELNTIVISREEFCHFPTNKRPQLTCKPELVQSLYIRDLAASTRCAARMSCPWPIPTTPCQNCRASLLGLINTLRLKPKLQEVFIDYHGYHHAVRALFEGLSDVDHGTYGIRLTCTGIGRYVLDGRMLRGFKFTLRDVALSEIWTRVLSIPWPQPFHPWFRANRMLWKYIKSIEPSMLSRLECQEIAIKLLVLIIYHDAGMIPTNFAGVWPSGARVDFRRMEEVDPPDLLHEFNVQLQAYLEVEPVALQSLVPRT